MRASSKWLLCLVVLTMTPACGNNAAETPRPARDELRFELRAKGTVVSGEPVVITFRLFGHPTQAVQVLRWNTPLEGLRSRIFLVTRDGADIPYGGRMYKRGDPVREDYVALAAGGELQGEVDLASAYDMRQPGEYRITFTGELLDIAPANAVLPRRREQFVSATLRGEPIVVRIAAR